MPLSGHAPGEAVVGVTVAFTVMALITVGLRLWARLAVARNAGWDDMLIVLALVFSIATTVTMVVQVQAGMGRHQDTINAVENTTMLKAFYVSIWVYNLSLSSTKISVLLQYLRIFPQRTFRIVCYSLLAVVVTYSLYTFFTAVFACTPIAYFWDASLNGRCLNRFAIWFANAGVNIATDILTAAISLPMLKQLELPRRQKTALMIVFGLAGFTCIVSILRLQSLYVISQSTDVSWDNPLAAIWSSVEANTAILCSCLPTLRCFFPRLLRATQLSLTGLSREGEHNNNHNYNHSNHNTTPTRHNQTPRLFPSLAMRSRITSSVTAASGPYPPLPPSYERDAKSDEVSLEEFRKGGGGDREHRWRHHARQKSGHCRSRRREESSDEIELGDSSARRPFPNGIHVTTAIEQEVERKEGGGGMGGDDSSSTRELMRKEGI